MIIVCLRKRSLRVDDHFLRNDLDVKYALNQKNERIFRPVSRNFRYVFIDLDYSQE